MIDGITLGAVRHDGMADYRSFWVDDKPGEAAYIRKDRQFEITIDDLCETVRCNQHDWLTAISAGWESWTDANEPDEPDFNWDDRLMFWV